MRSHTASPLPWCTPGGTRSTPNPVQAIPYPASATSSAREPPEPLETWGWPRAQPGCLGWGDGPQGIPGPELLMAGTDGYGAVGRTCSLVMPGSVGERSGLPHAGVCAGGVGREPGRQQRGLQWGERQLLGPVTAARSGGSEPPRLGPMQSSAASTQAPAAAGRVQCPSRSLRWWPGTAGWGSAPCDAWLRGPSSPTHPRGVSHCETTPATPRNCVPMPAPLGFPFPRSKWLHGPVGSAAGAAGVSPRLP